MKCEYTGRAMVSPLDFPKDGDWTKVGFQPLDDDTENVKDQAR